MSNDRIVDDAMQQEKDTRAELIKSKLENLNEEDLVRFEFFIRSHFTRQKVKDVMAGVIGKPPNDEQAIICSSLTKLFVGELIETASAIARKRTADAIDDVDNSSSNINGNINSNNNTNLNADDVRGAVRQMQKSQKMTISGSAGGGLSFFERRVPPPVLDDSDDAEII